MKTFGIVNLVTILVIGFLALAGFSAPGGEADTSGLAALFLALFAAIGLVVVDVIWLLVLGLSRLKASHA